MPSKKTRTPDSSSKLPAIAGSPTRASVTRPQKAVHFGGRQLKEFDVLGETTAFLSMKESTKLSNKIKQPLSKAERFINELNICLSNPSTFDQFYDSCINFLKNKKPGFNELDLRSKHVLKYILACANEINLSFGDDLGYQKQVYGAILDMLTACESLKKKYEELDSLLIEQAKFDKAALNVEQSTSDEGLTPTPPHPIEPNIVGSAAVLAELSQGASPSPDPQPPSQPKVTAAGNMLKSMKPAAEEDIKAAHTHKPPSK